MSNVEFVLRNEGPLLVPTVNVHGSENTAPSAATVLVDTGQLANIGWYRAIVSWATTDTAANILQIAHRNAANSADLELADLGTGVLAGGAGGGGYAEAIFQVSNVNERIVVRNKNAGTSSLFYQVNIALYLLN